MNNLRSLTLFDIYEKNATHLGQRPAIHWKQHDISYADLFDQTCRLAKGLQSLDLKPGSRVAILLSNHPAFFHLFGAAAALNLILVLINKRLSTEEIRTIVEDTTPECIISDETHADVSLQLRDDYSFVNHCFIIDAKDPLICFSDLYQPDPIENAVPCNMDDPHIIIHTAAVEGKPRGAVLSHQNVILAGYQTAMAFNLANDPVYLNILPLFHIMAINVSLGVLLMGGKNVLLEKFDPPRTLELIQSQNVTVFGSFPPILNNLMETAQTVDVDFSSLKLVAGLEQPETVQKWEALTSSKFWTMYGQTETSGLVTFSEYFAKKGSAGKISLLANIKIVDDHDTLLPVGMTGEIVIKGPLVFQGYWNTDDLNARTFREGWHHTGDLGMIDTEGFLFFKGRKAERELIKPGGENVFPVEVEKAILQHPSIKDVCVFGVPDPKFGEGIKAVCSLHKGEALTAGELIDFTATKIAGYKKPRIVEFIDELPRKQDGSIDRQAVKQAY